MWCMFVGFSEEACLNQKAVCVCPAEHLPDVFKHPDSDVPIPYTELLITATPGYKKRDAGAATSSESTEGSASFPSPEHARHKHAHTTQTCQARSRVIGIPGQVTHEYQLFTLKY